MLKKNPFISAHPIHVFQNIVSKHSSQFRGNAQHDALEFLLWLLDRMHEDLGAASPAQQSRGPTQVGAPPPCGGKAVGPGLDQEHRDVLRGGGMELAPAPVGMARLWFGQ